LKDRKNKHPNFWEFSCIPFADPTSISIQKWWNIKTCTSAHLKKQKEFSYNNICNLNENTLMESITKNQLWVYKDIWIEEIIKLIKSKRNWDFICLNNMLAKKI
jgi:hypothetical protein